MNLLNKIFFIALTLALFNCSDQKPTIDHWKLYSPQKNIQIDLQLLQGKLYYTVSSDSQNIFAQSQLGVKRSDTDLSQGLSLDKELESHILSGTYPLVSGKKAQLVENGIQYNLPLINGDNKKITVQFNVYDDGLALRYVFPDKSDSVVTIEEEMTEFHFAERGKTWMQTYGEVTKYTPANEQVWENGIEIGSEAPQSNGWAFPALFETANHWVLLSDAGIDGDYSGMHLQPTAQNLTYKLRWAEETEAMGFYDAKPSSNLPWQTSWKTIALGNDLNDIVNSDLTMLVSPPNRLDDISWIKPGRASWSWLSDHDSPQDFDKLKSFIDLAVEMNWEYSLVDANWNDMKGGTIEELIEYANSKNIGIMMWYNSGGKHNEVTEAPRSIMDDPDKRKQEFEKLENWGVKGVKIDFFQSDKIGMMKLYKDILEDAAKNHILVNFHGCAIPRGWGRTYPHHLTMESIRGAESYTFAPDYPNEAITINSIAPFTRNVIGSMDYTPVIFTDMQFKHLTTYGHELALSVVFESGIQHFADAVSGYQNLPAEAKTFLKEIPVTWDETRVLQGYPGKEVIIARKKGENWYLGGINSENKAKVWTIDVTSLFDGPLRGVIIKDGENATSFEIKEWSENQTMEIEVLPYGGFSAQLMK